MSERCWAPACEAGGISFSIKEPSIRRQESLKNLLAEARQHTCRRAITFSLPGVLLARPPCCCLPGVTPVTLCQAA